MAPPIKAIFETPVLPVLVSAGFVVEVDVAAAAEPVWCELEALVPVVFALAAEVGVVPVLAVPEGVSIGSV